MNAKFFAPDGNDISNISADQIVKLIRLNDAEYWESGSGDAAIRFPTDEAGELIFMLRRSLGIFLQYTEPTDDNEWVQSDNTIQDEIVSVIQGGTPWELPRAYFIDQALAEQIIVEFIKTAKRPNLGTWVPF